jgi:hypothetical protein
MAAGLQPNRRWARPAGFAAERGPVCVCARARRPETFCSTDSPGLDGRSATVSITVSGDTIPNAWRSGHVPDAPLLEADVVRRNRSLAQRVQLLSACGVGAGPTGRSRRSLPALALDSERTAAQTSGASLADGHRRLVLSPLRLAEVRFCTATARRGVFLHHEGHEVREGASCASRRGLFFRGASASACPPLYRNAGLSRGQPERRGVAGCIPEVGDRQSRERSARRLFLWHGPDARVFSLTAGSAVLRLSSTGGALTVLTVFTHRATLLSVCFSANSVPQCGVFAIYFVSHCIFKAYAIECQ